MATARRRVFSAAALLSAFLLIATVALWMRSYCVTEGQDRLYRQWDGADREEDELYWMDGAHLRGEAHLELSYRTYRHAVGDRDFRIGVDGLSLQVSRHAYISYGGIYCLYRSLCGIFIIVPTVWIATSIRRSRRQVSPFACRVCGYDLRATPDRCPECGAANESTSLTKCPRPTRVPLVKSQAQ